MCACVHTLHYFFFSVFLVCYNYNKLFWIFFNPVFLKRKYQITQNKPGTLQKKMYMIETSHVFLSCKLKIYIYLYLYIFMDVEFLCIFFFSMLEKCLLLPSSCVASLSDLVKTYRSTPEVSALILLSVVCCSLFPILCLPSQRLISHQRSCPPTL